MQFPKLQIIFYLLYFIDIADVTQGNISVLGVSLIQITK